MCICADKYNLPTLSALAVGKFNVHLQDTWATWSLVRAICLLYTSPLAGGAIDEREIGPEQDHTALEASSPSGALHSAASGFNDSNNMVQLLLKKSPLRGHLLEFLSEHLSALAHSPLKPVIAIRALLHTLPLFAGDICYLTFSQSWRKLRRGSMHSTGSPQSTKSGLHIPLQPSSGRHNTLNASHTPADDDAWQVLDNQTPMRRRLSLATSAIAAAFTKVLPASPPPGPSDLASSLASEASGGGRPDERYRCGKCSCDYTVHDPGMDHEFVCPRVSCGGRAGWDERLA
jgi:hypothetical protein